MRQEEAIFKRWVEKERRIEDEKGWKESRENHVGRRGVDG